VACGSPARCHGTPRPRGGFAPGIGKHIKQKAKEDGYRNLANVYKDEEFNRTRDNPKQQEVVRPPPGESSA